ncbi:YebF family protein [Pantoea agglomerans]
MAKIHLQALMLISVTLPIIASANTSDNGCSVSGKDHAIAVVKNDFINRMMPRWKSEEEKLGTKKPELIISVKNSEISTESGAYFIPFKAKGTKGTAEYFGLVDCKSDFVEYSTKN